MTVSLKRPDIKVPELMSNLPLTEKGYLKPWFVKEDDFRVMDGQKAWLAVSKQNCWVCGNSFTPNEYALVSGEIGAMIRACREPPCHVECAVYALQVCPFLLYPNAKRRVAGLDEEDTLQFANEKLELKGTEDNPGEYYLTIVKDFTCVHEQELMLFNESDVLERQFWVGGNKQDSIPDPIFPLEELTDELKNFYLQTNR